LLRKHNAAKKHVPAPIIDKRKGAGFGVVTIGGCDLAVREALVTLEKQGVAADYMRIRAFPFGDEVEAFLAEHDRIFVVEQNRDAQLKSLITLETKTPKEKLYSIIAYGGFPLQAAQVIAAIRAHIPERETRKTTIEEQPARVNGGAS
jgi:2-oxoglutarate ferredoxin oxidoreductase subunit alpha